MRYLLTYDGYYNLSGFPSRQKMPCSARGYSSISSFDSIY